jgi:signal transduction histidine kinase
MLGHTLLSRNGRRIRISQRLMAQPRFVLGDRTQLQQVLLNLGVNARDAMPSGGEFVIETCAAELDEEYCRDHVGASPGRYLMISVTDAGTGIPKEIVDRIFERARGWASRWSTASSRTTAALCGCTARSGAGQRSRSICP